MLEPPEFYHFGRDSRNLILLYANSKGANQSAHPRSLISAFVVRFLEHIMTLLAMRKISILKLVSVAEKTGSNLTWSENPKIGFLATRSILE